jgi:hypothetical protein
MFPSWYATPENVALNAGGDISESRTGIYVGGSVNGVLFVIRNEERREKRKIDEEG